MRQICVQTGKKNRKIPLTQPSPDRDLLSYLKKKKNKKDKSASQTKKLVSTTCALINIEPSLDLGLCFPPGFSASVMCSCICHEALRYVSDLMQ